MDWMLSRSKSNAVIRHLHELLSRRKVDESETQTVSNKRTTASIRDYIKNNS